MSFLKRVSDAGKAGLAAAGERVGEVAAQVGDSSDPEKPSSLRESLSAVGERAKEGLGKASTAINDPANQAAAAAKARAGMGVAKKSLSGMVDKIDPDLFAEVIIKATSIQERINARLKEKASPYRVADIEIAVAFPLPEISFTISRVEDPNAPLEAASTELLEAAGEGALEASYEDAALEADLDAETGNPSQI